MNTSSLRRALLVLAVIAFMIARAAAETGSDAGFASALAEGAPAPAAFARARAKPQKPAAAPKAPAAPEAVWAKVLDAVKKDGVYKPGVGPLPGMFTIEDSSGDPKGVRQTQSIVVAGMINDEELFEAMGAMLVSTSQTVDPKTGNLIIDQWMFQTNIYGDVGQAGHGVVVQTPDGKTVSAAPDALNPADPKIQAQYDSMLRHWAERKPKGA